MALMLTKDFNWFPSQVLNWFDLELLTKEPGLNFAKNLHFPKMF